MYWLTELIGLTVDIPILEKLTEVIGLPQYIIQLEKCTVVLTSSEINNLLQKDTELFKQALKRGKYYLRGKQQQEREQAKFERETGNKRAGRWLDGCFFN